MSITIYILYIFALLITGLISLWIAWFARHRRSAPGSHELAVLMLLVASWSLAVMAEGLSSSYTWKLIWTILSYPGNMIVPVWFLVFVLRFTQQDQWLTRKRLWALLIVPILSVGMAITNYWHGLLWPEITVEVQNGITIARYAHGPWFWIELAYSYIAVLSAILTLARAVIRYPELYSIQVRLMLLASQAPLLLNVIYAFYPNAVAGIDLTPIAFSFTGIILAWALFRYSLLDVAPIAHDRIWEIVPDGMMVVDHQNRLVDSNPAGQRLFGWEQVPIGSFVDELWSRWPELLALCHTTKDTSAEVDLTLDEKPHSFYFSVTMLRNRDGNLAGRILLMRDITARRQAESQVYLQAQALNSAANGIVITDSSGTIQWINPAFTQLTGYELEDVNGKSTSILKSGHYSSEYYENMWATISAGNVWHNELINRHKDGSEYFEEMTITPVVRPDGAISHYIAIKQDVTARKQVEVERQRAHDEALAANRMKTQLLANVSHDLRTPMGAIMGFADMLRSGIFGDVNEKQIEACSEIIDSANNLMAFVNNLIGQAQLETGKIVLKNRPFDPNELLETAQMAGSFLAKKKNLIFTCQAEGNFPPELNGDLYWLRQIMTNLVSNAVKFTDDGFVSVRMYLPDSEHWAIQVEDSGAGIPEDARTTVFESFQQVDGSATRRHGGSGLGLAIVEELSQLMNGKIVLESAIGVGSTFIVTLPLNHTQESR